MDEGTIKESKLIYLKILKLAYLPQKSKIMNYDRGLKEL